jgi:large subunit ribosomal protein L24
LQTTLLGLAIAIILALVAALVAPLLIDWSGYRSIFEAEASHLVGVDVRVTGAIEARLLPSPRLTLHDIEVGKGPEKIRARSLGIEFALTPLMRNEWRATELHLSGPSINLKLDTAGHLRTPSIAVSFNPDALTVERLGIEDGTVKFIDAVSGASVTFDKLWFNGEARSLLGPFKGEGAVTIAGELYPFRLASGRYNDEGAIKLHVNVDPVSRPLSIEADGALTLSDGEPHFDGNLTLSRPVGIAASSAQTLTQPWRLAGKLKLDPRSTLLDQAEFQYGSEDQGVKLTGVANLKFGKNARFDGVLSGRQIDLDRVLVAKDGSRPPPAAALRELAELVGSAFRPAIPVSIGVGIDQVALGGGAVQNLRGDISSDTDGWNLDRFEFRAPGFTQVRLSGHLAVAADGVAFTGPAEVNASDPKALAVWLEGRGEPSTKAAADLRPLRLRGDVTLSNEKVALDNLTANFDRKPVTGKLAYIFAAGGTQAKLDAALNAPELDLDAALGFGKALLAGSTVARPSDMTIAADIGRATFGDLVAHDASARLKIDTNGLQIDKLAIADFGGGSFAVKGRIDTGGNAPRGSLSLDFETRQMAAIASLVTKFAPKQAGSFVELLGRTNHATLRGTLDVAADKADNSKTDARLAVAGDLDAMHLDTSVRVTGDWEKPASADLRVDGAIEAPDGAMLVKLLGLDSIVVAGKGPGQFKLVVAGPMNRDMQIDLLLRAGDLSARSIGRGTLSLDKGVKLSSTLDVTNAALRSLRPGVGREALPVSVNSRVTIDGGKVSADNIVVRMGGASIRGKLSVDGASPRRINGALEADNVDGPALIASAIAMPVAPSSQNANWVWAAEPFGDGIFGDFTGTVTLKARKLDLLPRLTAREFRALAKFGKDELTLDDMAGVLAGGRLAGRMVFKDSGLGLTAQAKLSLNGADASLLLPAQTRPAVTGALDLSAELEGGGLSPVALIGSLHGSGKIALSDGQMAGLDPRAFDAVTRAVDRGLSIDRERISNVVRKALESGQLAVKRAEGDFAVSAGQLRLTNVRVVSPEADLSLAGNVDLIDGTLDARLVLSGSDEAAGARPDIFMALRGPAASPSQTIDVSALTGWLTLRAVEHQAKRLKEIEAAQPRSVPPGESVLKNSESPNNPKTKLAPALPPPMVIGPTPRPAAAPPASVGPQN